MGRAYYNERDPYAAAWLENLIAAGEIAPGDVDTRDILDVRPADLDGYVQCHFFAGIGVWSRALREAGWPDDRPVWTGSCPCQPFSAPERVAGRDDVVGLADNNRNRRGAARAGGLQTGQSELPQCDSRHITADPTDGYWRDADWLWSRDGKWRPVEPGTFPLAHAAPARMGRLRAYGNGLDLAQAAGFIRAYMERDMGRNSAVADNLFEWAL